MSATPARSRPRGNSALAILLMALALVCFTGLDSSAKYLSRELPSVEVIWARYLGAALVAVAATRVFVRPGLLRSRRPGLQGLRSLLLLGSTAGNFLALQTMQLAETSTITFLAPIFVALLSGPLLGEWPGRAQIVAIAVGFLGVVVATRPGVAAFQPVALVAMAGALCNAGYFLATRGLAGRDSGQTTFLWTQAAGVVALTPLLPWFWTAPSHPLGWALLAAMGGFGAVGHALLIRAHQLAPAALLAPFTYTQLLWMIASGWLLFGDWPPAATFVGAGLVVGGGLFLVLNRRAAGTGK